MCGVRYAVCRSVCRHSQRRHCVCHNIRNKAQIFPGRGGKIHNARHVKEPEYGGLAVVYYRRYPRFVAAMKNRHKKYNNTRKLLRRLEEEGRAMVIAPSRELDIGRTCNDPEKLQQVYDLGRRDAIRQLGNLEVFLENRE